MKQHIAFIGSSVADVIIRIPHLPVRQEDINIESQTLSLGGCAFNAAWMCRLLGGDPLFFSPVGTGIYGDFVRRQLQEHRIDILLESKEENGCCFCLVESDGERTFLSHHGAEYRFQKEWFSLLDSYGVDTVYVCGLELEEKTGIYILDYLQKHPQLIIYFAPGPRLSALSQGCIKTLFNLHCILHLNEEEACSFTGCPTAQQAAESLYERTHNIVIITLGSRGCLLQQEGKCTHIPTEAVQIQDTIGAGDAHIGSIIALREQGYSWQDTLRIANRICGYIVSIPGALMHEDELTALSLFRNTAQLSTDGIHHKSVNTHILWYERMFF